MQDDTGAPQLTLNRSLAILLTVAVMIFLLEKIVLFIQSFSEILLMLALAWLLTFILRPAIMWLHERRVSPRLQLVRRNRRLAASAVNVPYGVAVFVVYLVLLTAFVLLTLAFLPTMTDQIDQLARLVQGQAGNVPQWIESATALESNLRGFLATRLRIDPNSIALPSPQDLINQAPIIGSRLVEVGFGLAGGLAKGLGQFFIVLFLSLFLSYDGGILSAALKRVIPRRFEDEYELAAATIDRTFGGYLRGNVLQSIIYGVGVGTLMRLLGISSALVVGVASGLAAFVPVIGGVVGIIAPLLVALIQGSGNALWLLVLLVLFQGILFNVVMPPIFSESLQMPTILVITSLLAGTQLMGFWGFVFAVPLAAAIYSIGFVLLERVKLRQDARDEVDGEGQQVT